MLLRQTPPKPKLLRSNPHRVSLIFINGFDPLEIEISDDFIYVGYTRRSDEFEFILEDDDEELSSYVKLRLFLARQMALRAYRKKQEEVA
jgi:hypothetical protein